MKNYRKNISRAVSNATDLPIDVVCGLPYIHVYSDREAVIEGCCSICEYTSELLGVVCKNIRINVVGKELYLKQMDEIAVVVRGNISGIYFGEKL